MKRFTAALALAAQLLTLAPMPARAAYPSQDAQALNINFRVPKNKRVIVVRPLRWETGLASPVGEVPCIANGVYQAIDQLRYLGCHVDYVSSRIFESYANGTKLWRELGDTYGLCIVLNPGQFTAGMQRYVNGDSTNVQLLVVGGVRSNVTAQWSNGDTLVRGMFDATSSISSCPEALSSVRTAFVIPYSRTSATGLASDTVWADRIATGRMACDSAGFRPWSTTYHAYNAGITGVFRVLHPGALGNPAVSFVNFNNVQNLDSANASLPTSVDSTARSAEWLGPIWKVKYAAGGANPNPSEVWFIKFVGGTANVATNRCTPTLLWACIARFIDVPAIKYALDFDDVTNINDSANQPRWRNQQAESLLAVFDRYGLKVGSNGIHPGNAPGYVRGFTPEAETQPYAAGTTDSVPWQGNPLGLSKPGHSYIKRLIWTHHSHDSTNGSISSNLVGAYGGYPTTNGVPPLPVNEGSGHTGRRYASRWNPGANESDQIGAGGNFGILQRLQYSDSVRAALGVRPDRPPYLTFPANQMLPINWRQRHGGVNWPTVGGIDYDSLYTVHDINKLCPIDSLLWVFDYFLHRGADCGLGRITLRSGMVAARGIRNEALWGDRDSIVAQVIAQYPRDRWTTRIGSRLVQAEIVHSFNQGVSTRAVYLGNSNIRAATWMGLANRANHAEYNNPIYGESYDSDAGKQMNAGTGYRDFPARQATRIVYFHPSGLAGAPSVMGDYSTEQVILGIHSHIRAMDDIAGRAVAKCVMPWQVYD